MSYVVIDGPSHVAGGSGDELPGHYEVHFRSPDGTVSERYLTDKGRAALLRLIDEGQGTFTHTEVEDLSTPATIEDLLATMVAESGDGA